MTREEITAFLQRRQEALDRLDAVVLASLHTVDGVVESPIAGGSARGREAIEGVYRSAFMAFSPTFRQEELLIDGDYAVQVARMSGTDHGGLTGLPPTERAFSVSLVSLYEFRDGLIARERRIYDFTGLLIQIGAMKVKPA